MNSAIIFAGIIVTGLAASQPDDRPASWTAGPTLLTPGQTGSFDARAVKDPTVVQHAGKWHVFYTACGPEKLGIAYVSAPSWDELNAAPRTLLKQLAGGVEEYAAAPQVFYFSPHETWYLIYQTKDSNYQPVYSTTKSIDNPDSWTRPKPLLPKQEKAKWIDFWLICDESTACLFYTRNHRDVFIQTTPIEAFPEGFTNPRSIFQPVHEAVHVYKSVQGPEYHMLYEIRTDDAFRKFGLATAPQLAGPWTDITSDYVTIDKCAWPQGVTPWTDNVSHGEFLRTGCDQFLEYDPASAQLLIQGRQGSEQNLDYRSLTWSLGLLTPVSP